MMAKYRFCAHKDFQI